MDYNAENCQAFKYDFDEKIAESVVFAAAFIIGTILIFTGLWSIYDSPFRSKI